MVKYEYNNTPSEPIMTAARQALRAQHGGMLPNDVSHYDVQTLIGAIQDKELTAQVKALACLLFLSGCRISEVLRYYPDKRCMSKKDTTYPSPYDRLSKIPFYKQELVKNNGFLPGMRKHDIRIKTDSIEFHNVRTLKQRQPEQRTIVTLFDPEEQWFVDVLKDYLATIPNDADELFPTLHRVKAAQVLSKNNLFPHYFRHIRNTIMVRYYGYNEYLLMLRNGWKKPDTATFYVHLNPADELNQQKKARQKQ